MPVKHPMIQIHIGRKNIKYIRRINETGKGRKMDELQRQQISPTSLNIK